jgi:hypothetical protein
MKKLILLMIIAFATMAVNAQSGTTVNLKSGQFLYEYAGTSLDTTTGTWDKSVLLLYIPQKVVVNSQLKIHNNGSAKANITLYGKVFSTDSYTSVATLYYAGGQDTVINFAITTATAFRYLKWGVAATAGTPKVTWLKTSLKY